MGRENRRWRMSNTLVQNLLLQVPPEQTLVDDTQTQSSKDRQKAYGIIHKKETGKMTGTWNSVPVVRRLAQDEETI